MTRKTVSTSTTTIQSFVPASVTVSGRVLPRG
jgi:hypothetical protein